jgi:NAD(P)-dependent dehydrogenase (short-subunit alcohol dehydrogenase family)
VIESKEWCVGHLDGKVAIVTGGGRGIGRSHALALAREGAAVVVNDLGGDFNGEGSPSTEPAEEVAQEIVAAGGRAVVNGTDVSDWDAVAGIVETALEAFGRLDIVLNNACISRFAAIGEVTRYDWERTIDVGLNGTAALCNWAAAHWRKEGPEAGRRIINTASSVGLTPIPGNPMYVAAKAGVAALTIACAIELAEFGVRANALAPVARTRISKVVAAELMNNIPVGFDPLSPDHVGALGVFLASPQCRFTGRVFGVIGDDVTIFDGWSTAHYVGNDAQPWTVATLEAALVDVPSQQDGKVQAFKGMDRLLTPTDAVLERLAAVENA